MGQKLDFVINCYGTVCIGWELLHVKATEDHLGYLPSFIANSSKVKLAKQINNTYQSGWLPFGEDQWKIIVNDAQSGPVIKYPGDPAMRPIAKYEHKPTGETLYLYDSAVTMIMQKDGSFEISRLD